MVGTQVLHRRETLGLTQEELARKSGIKQFHISLIENEHVREVRSDTLRKLARALNVSADWLLELEHVGS